MFNLLIVCMGNVCRSPMAQAVLGKLIAEAGLPHRVQVKSAGTHASRNGEKVDARVTTALAKRGYNTNDFRSRRVTSTDFELYDMILAMDSETLANLAAVCPANLHQKLRLFMHFSDAGSAQDVPDPYYGNPQGFEQVLDMCVSGSQSVLQHLWQTDFAANASQHIAGT